MLTLSELRVDPGPSPDAVRDALVAARDYLDMDINGELDAGAKADLQHLVGVIDTGLAAMENFSERYRYKRIRLGLLYALGCLSEQDAQEMHYDICDIAGWYPLASLGRESVLGNALERWWVGGAAGLDEFVARACRRVYSKWDGGGVTEAVGAAEDWACDLIAEYARDAGVTLEEVEEDSP